MSAEIKISLIINRIRWQKEDAAGCICGICGDVAFGKHFRAFALIKIENLPVEEIQMDLIVCEPCFPSKQ